MTTETFSDVDLLGAKAKQEMERIDEYVERVNKLISDLKEKKKKLVERYKKFKLPHFCPFCASTDIVKPFVVPGTCYLCKTCDRGFRISFVSKAIKRGMKEAIALRKETRN